MHVDPELLERVSDKLNKQNALKAVLGVAFWCIPMLVGWYVVFDLVPRFVPMMLVISGAGVGFAVRYYGAGYGRRFSLIAFLAHLILVIVAFNIGILLTGTIWGVILLGLYLSGAWAAAFFARKRIPLTENNAFYVLTEQQPHASDRALKNRWFVAFPALFTLVPITTVCTAAGIYLFHGYSQKMAMAQDYVQDIARHEAKNIDVTPKSLDTFSTKEALYYAYSYYSGRQVSSFGQYKGEFPHSAFKAKTILSYLVKQRKDPRAAFILARLSEGKLSGDMLKTAIDQGDEYAKFYSLVEFGCAGETMRAKQLLQGMRRLAKEQPIVSDIQSVMDYGFEFICNDLNTADFPLRFIRAYSPPKETEH